MSARVLRLGVHGVREDDGAFPEAGGAAGPERPAGSARRSPAPGLSLRWHPRAALVGAGLLALTGVLLLLAVAVGDFPLPLREVWAALTGSAEGAGAFIVQQVRLPRALAAVGAGIAFGISGALFQTLVRNPLGSPELIGFTQGASAGAVAGIVVARVTGGALAGWALAGGVVTALAVYVLAVRRGVLGPRLVLVGIGIGAMLNAVTWWLLTRADLATAQTAAAWLVGSLHARTWGHVTVLGVALLVLAPVGLLAGRWLRLVELGDDTARALGLPLRRAQLLLAALGVATCALAVVTAGPVAFVALIAPQLARRLVGGAGIGLVSSALTGAALLLASDILGQRLLAPVALPVGVMTGAIGGVYLAWLLTREGRRVT